MSHEASAWVGQKSKAKGSELLVLYIIANHAHPDGTGSWPSIKTIAAESKMSTRGIRYIVERLVELGDIEVARSKHGGDKWTGRNEYTITGVLRDGFYIPKCINEDTGENFAQADQGQTRGKAEERQGQTRGKYSATELEVELEHKQEESAPGACPKCGARQDLCMGHRKKKVKSWPRRSVYGRERETRHVEEVRTRSKGEERADRARKALEILDHPERIPERLRPILPARSTR